MPISSADASGRETLWAPLALLPGGWVRDVRLRLEASGRIAAIEQARAPASGDLRLPGPVLPGMANLHSHAFQRAMAGLAEIARDPEDSFWSWRDLMYRLVGRLRPEQVEAIARYLYIEMLKAGYTGVADVHYLHHDWGGARYADPAEMANRHLAAAEAAGIAITLLPVMYAHAGFGGKAPSAAQARFIHGIDDFLALGAALRKTLASRSDGGEHRLGLAFHSLRAVTEAEMQAILAAWPQDGPIHIHIAEQRREVEDCLAWSGQQPIDWLADRVALDSRWSLIHATHALPDEAARVAASGAVIGLCPTTEANLGDGFFPAEAYLAAGGRFGIGSDSHVSLDLREELRWLEYGARLQAERRNRLHGPDRPHVARFLYEEAAASGALALGCQAGGLEAGKRADLVVLDGAHPLFAGLSGDDLLGRWIFAGRESLLREVWVGGRRIIAEGRHPGEEAAGAAFAAAMRDLV